MKFEKVFILLVSLLIVSCASTKQKKLSDYDKDLNAPVTTNEYVLKDKKVFENPSLGAMLKYENRDYPEDTVTVYVYPINAISWDDKSEIIQDELLNAIRDVDAAIEYGHYKSRTSELISDISFNAQNTEFVGKKAEFTIITKNDVPLYSDVFMFIAEDKYIKFRTSFDKRSTNRSMGDETVKSLLPQLKVPSESIYMKELRAAHEKKIQQDLMRLLQQALENSNS